ncbi:MAG: hypothetical protein JWQ81_8584 [Amycolatopsis sp.]|uniref:hypothetical protein n=1 Tax=Amycolatopsis sp. TaxID=37632 RepID=UPI0026306C10|nr:hypothetical protein [Amycolatopsis sp.]MCU1687845.1 hypothetical protein [Amycolatopsis sp.]
MSEPNYVPMTVPAGSWSKVVKQIEHDLGGPILPHTPAPLTPSELPVAPNLGVAPTPAETLALADELTAAGTPDELLVAAEMRAAIIEHVCAELRVDPAEIGVGQHDHDYGVMPTVGFHEPPQPGWLARVIRRVFG